MTPPLNLIGLVPVLCSGDEDSYATCRAPINGTGSCPTGSSMCACPACTLGTSGPCHGPAGMCSAYDTAGPGGSGRCPYGYFECGSGVTPTPVDRVCAACGGGSTGPCQHLLSKLCYDFVSGVCGAPSVLSCLSLASTGRNCIALCFIIVPPSHPPHPSRTKCVPLGHRGVHCGRRHPAWSPQPSHMQRVCGAAHATLSPS